MQSAKIVSEVITVFSRESLEPYDIIDSVDVSLLSILHTIGIRSWTEGLDVPRGRPRYVKGIFQSYSQNFVQYLYLSPHHNS